MRCAATRAGVASTSRSRTRRTSCRWSPARSASRRRTPSTTSSPASSTASAVAPRVASIVPDAIPQDRLDRLGARASKVRRYPGPRRRSTTSTGSRPDPGVLDELGVDRDRDDRRRPDAPGRLALPPRGEPVVRRRARADSGATMPSRPSSSREQRSSARRSPRGRCRRSSCPSRRSTHRASSRFADLVVSAGGTMNREAVALGIPVYTTFAGRLGAVDTALVNEGRLRVLTSAEDLELEKRKAARNENGTRSGAPARPHAHGPRALARTVSIWLRSLRPSTGRGEMRKRRRIALLAAAVAAMSVASVTAALAGDNDSGFQTSQAAMLTCPTCTKIVPIITVGETLPGGYRFEALPDGISLKARGNGRVDLFVNHETSTVAFPYNAAAPTAANSQNDFLNSQVSLLGLNQHSKRSPFRALRDQLRARTTSGSAPTTSQRRAEGFDRDIFFTNEEAQDYVYRTGTAWSQPIAPGTAGAEQAGVVVRQRPKDRKAQDDLRDGPAQPRKRRRDPGIRRPRRPLGRRHLLHDTGDDDGGPAEPDLRYEGLVAGVQLHRAGHRRDLERSGRPVGVRVDEPVRTRTTTTSHPATRRRSTASSSRCRR